MSEQISTIQTSEVLELMRNLAPILNQKELFEFMLFSNRVLKRYMPEYYNDELSEEVTEMRKDKAWLRDEVSELYPSYDEMYVSPDYETVAKTETISKVLELIDQLEEPEKPVIPKFVADWIESYRKKTLVELINDAVYSSDEDSKCFRRWFHEEMGFESNYSEFLARVWLDGFTITNEDEELWKPIENHEGLYEVSNKGNIRSLDRDVQYKKTDFTMKIMGVDLKPNVLKKGYLQVSLSKSGKRKSMLVHRLVMNAFNPTADDNLQINHIDGNKENNEVSNLEWVTAIENTNHAYDIGLRDDTIGNNRKLTEDEVLEIIDLYETGNYTQKELGNKYNVGRNTIGEILLGKTWGWLTGITREVEKEKKNEWRSFVTDPPDKERIEDIFEIDSEHFKEPIWAKLYCDANGRDLYFTDMYGSSFSGYINYREVVE